MSTNVRLGVGEFANSAVELLGTLLRVLRVWLLVGTGANKRGRKGQYSGEESGMNDESGFVGNVFGGGNKDTFAVRNLLVHSESLNGLVIN